MVDVVRGYALIGPTLAAIGRWRSLTRKHEEPLLAKLNTYYSPKQVSDMLEAKEDNRGLWGELGWDPGASSNKCSIADASATATAPAVAAAW